MIEKLCKSWRYSTSQDGVVLYDFLCWRCKESWTCIPTEGFDYLFCVVASIVESRKSRNTSRREVPMRQITVDSRQLSRQNHMRCQSLVLVAKISSPHALQYDLRLGSCRLRLVCQAAMSRRKHRLHVVGVQRWNIRPSALGDTCDRIPGRRRSNQWLYNLFDTKRSVDTHAHIRFLK